MARQALKAAPRALDLVAVAYIKSPSLSRWSLTLIYIYFERLRASFEVLSIDFWNLRHFHTEIHNGQKRESFTKNV